MDAWDEMMRAEFAREAADVRQATAPVGARVARRVRRRRAAQASVTATAAVAAVAAVGVGAWGLAGSGVREPALPIAGSPTPSAEPSTEPSTEPSGGPATPAEDPQGEDATFAPAPSRDSIAGEVTYPEAYLWEDAMWDEVGPGWGVGVASALADISYLDGAKQLPPAVLYLHSPDGVYFEVAELPEQWWEDTRVVSWDEDARSVRLWSRDAGARYDLETGKIEEVEFSIGGSPAGAERFVAADAGGAELWFASNDNGAGFYRWSGGQWEKAATWDDAPAARVPEQAPGMTVSPLDSTGSRVVLTVATDGEGFAPRPSDVVVYDLTADAASVYPVSEGAGATWMAPWWVDGMTVAFEVDGAQSAAELPSPPEPLVFAADPSLDRPELERLPNAVDVEYGQATPAASTEQVCGC